MINYLQDIGAVNLGWFTKEEAYKIADNLHAVVYALAFCEKKPDESLLSYQVQDVFYIGQSGNEEGKHFCYDQKVRKDMGTYKAPVSGRFYTNTKRRFKEHFRKFGNYDAVNLETDSSYKLFHEVFTPSLRPNCQIYCNIIVPPKPFVKKLFLLGKDKVPNKHKTIKELTIISDEFINTGKIDEEKIDVIETISFNTNLTKAWLRAVEDNMILAYGMRWGDNPVCNLENSNVSKNQFKNLDSISKRQIKSVTENNLKKFMYE